MRIAIQKSTGRVIEMQEHATPGTLVANAVSCGLTADDIEEREVTAAEYRTLLTNQPKTTEEANTEIRKQIQEIESGQARAIREAVLMGDTSRLSDINNRIAELRACLTA